MATGGYNASYEESGPTGFGNESLDDTSASNGGKSSGFSGDSAPLVGIDYKRYELWIFFVEFGRVLFFINFQLFL